MGGSRSVSRLLSRPLRSRRLSYGSVNNRFLLVLGVAVAATTVLVYHWQEGSRAFVDPTLISTPETEHMAATVARIAAESGAPQTPPLAVRAAPVPPRDIGTGAENGYAPTPPEGYSFVEFDGEMATAPLGVRRDGAQVRDGLDWLGATTALETLSAQAAEHGREWSFGWIRLAEGARQGDLAPSLTSAGAVIVGSSGRLLRARLPGDDKRLEAVAQLQGVGGVGAMPAEARLRAFDGHHVSDQEPTPVFVTLMEDDRYGRWRRELADLGVVVGRYDPHIRVYEANVTRGVLDVLGRADFVLAVEPVGTVEAAHDTAVPAMGADALRTYVGSPGLFSGVGGASVPIAVMDTGLNLNHLDISSNRSSICGANFVYYDPLVDDDDLWVDAGMHGTHVTGTIVGSGTAESRYTGMAPLVRHIRFAKVLSHEGGGNTTFIVRGMDFLAESTSCPGTGWSPDAVKPLVVNMSLSSSALVWEGRSVSERKLDSVVWDRRQLYVVAQSNWDIEGFSNFAAAKNSLAVGAVLDSGSLAGFSSHGPTADGRLAPQVVGAGVDVHSAKGDGSREEYQPFSGTSMASPAVAGLAALLMDAVPAHRERPALARARLMASAIRPDAWLDDAAAFPADNSNGPGVLQTQYGLGKASAHTSVLDRDRPDGWTSGSAVSELEDGEYAWVDIDVPDGASRLDIVLTWDEPPADTLASAVLNDLDLWLDHGVDCEPEPCGEHASTSRVDNVEWIVVRNPAPGTHRAKVAASRVYTEAPRAALAWTVVRGSATPDLELSVDRELLEVGQGDEERELELSLTVDGYVAAGTQLRVDCRGVNGSRCANRTIRVSALREDGIARQVDVLVGESVEVGELGAGETWKATIDFGYLADKAEAFRLYFKASAWNANAASATVRVRTESAGDADVPEVSAPSNDLFANATPIEGAEGSSVQVDPVRAVTEPGEPVFTDRYGRPAGSVWYSWTAPSDGHVSFSVTPKGARDLADKARVDVFGGSRITGLDPVGSREWGVQFFADSGKTYMIRVGYAGRAVPLTLNWSMSPRPTNDDLAAAAVLEGASGSVDGTNAGATLEAGEFFGHLGSTVWYRWTAPAEGSWKFESSVDNLRVLAFTGERLSDLRLVSGFPSYKATFPARDGDVYWIAVASRDAYASGLRYELTWDNHDREPGNDDFGGADEIAPGVSSHRVDIDKDATVEPGEPAGSGIRTKWWTWTAPASGRYVWRIDELTRPTTGARNRLMISVFTGEGLDDLQLVATNGERMSTDLDFSAEGGRRYWIAAGFPATDLGAFGFGTADATLVWGAAPENDDAAEAWAIMGDSGSVSGSNAFATNAHGERSFDVGRSTLWYVWEAPVSGFFRFTVDGDGGPWVLTVYRDAVDGSGLETVASSRAGGSAGNVAFHTSPGVRYMVVLGVSGGGRGGEFTLQWELADTSPLRYVGRLVDGERDSQGNPVEIRNPGALAMHPDGAALYLASGIGLQVFERDRQTGQLDYAQLLETDLSFIDGDRLLWDARHDRLLVDHCNTGEWQTFGVGGAGPELEYVGTVVGHHGSCPSEVLFLDGTGSHLYRITIWNYPLQHFTVDEDEILWITQYDLLDGSIAGTERAVAELSNDGRFIYVATDEVLQVFERNPESGELALADYEGAIDNRSPPGGILPLAITDDDAYLFVGEDRDSIAVFSVQDRLNPKRLATSARPAGGVSDRQNTCRFADARPESLTVDVFCDGLTIAARWDSESGELKFTNWAHPDFADPVGFAVSPDERHLYVVTRSDGIFIFARDGVDDATPEARSVVTATK